jgi:hypothetical protein
MLYRFRLRSETSHKGGTETLLVVWLPVLNGSGWAHRRPLA